MELSNTNAAVVLLYLEGTFVSAHDVEAKDEAKYRSSHENEACKSELRYHACFAKQNKSLILGRNSYSASL